MPGIAERWEGLLGLTTRYADCLSLYQAPLTDCTVPAMSAAQTRIAETIETFYGAADRSSDGAMASHAYKRSVDDMDGGFQRELVSYLAIVIKCRGSDSVR